METKFKAFDKRRNKIVNVGSIEFIDRIEGRTGCNVLTDGNKLSDCYWLDKGDFELMQFINSKDKDGTEVYQGYILEAPSGNKFEVKWYDDEMRWMMFAKYTWYNMNMELHKVVGNIYTNPELLK